MTAVAAPRLLWRIDEAAERVALGRSKFYELIARGEIRVVKVGRATRIADEALRDWVARRTSSVGDA